MDNTKKIKLLIATGSFGGPATYSRLLLRRLPAMGYDVEIADFESVLRYPKIFRHIIYFIKVLFQSYGKDIVYAQDPVSVGAPALLAAAVMRKRFFLKVVGDYAWEQGQQRFGVRDLLDTFVDKNLYAYPVLFFKWLQTFVAKRAEKIIVPSSYLKGILKKWGIDERKVHVVYNAFNKPSLHDEREALRKKYGFNEPTIIAVGRLVPWKNFDILIRAMKDVLAAFPDAQLVIVDDGPLKKVLVDQVTTLNLASSVSFVGKKPQAELYEMISAADIFVLPSSYEGFSHLILESLALDTPVVVSAVGGNSEVISDGENGLLVHFELNHSLPPYKLSEPIVRLLGDSMLRERLSKKGKEVVEQYTEDAMVQNLVKILR